MGSSAVLSNCRRYRYVLRRSWDDSRGSVLFIGLNPSTADESVDDPTIRRMLRFARDWGYGGIVVCNLFALRATDPRELWRAADPIGPANNDHLEAEAKRANLVVACWGVHGVWGGRHETVALMLEHLAGVDVDCLGVTADGHPKHPLYLSADTARVPYANAWREAS